MLSPFRDLGVVSSDMEFHCSLSEFLSHYGCRLLCTTLCSSCELGSTAGNIKRHNVAFVVERLSESEWSLEIISA